MFDIGFLEIITVGIVALVVLGPEKLPGTIRTVSLWIGRLRRSFNTIKQDIEKEIGADEIRRQLRNEEIMEKFRHTQAQVQNSIKSIKDDAEAFKKNVDLESQVANFMQGDKPKDATPPADKTAANISATTPANQNDSPAATKAEPADNDSKTL